MNMSVKQESQETSAQSRKAKEDTSSNYRLTPSEIESLRQDSLEAVAYGNRRWAHLRPQK